MPVSEMTAEMTSALDDTRAEHVDTAGDGAEDESNIVRGLD